MRATIEVRRRARPARAALLCLVAAALVAGAPLAAQNHPELEWQVLETDHFRVQFHQGLERAARYTAEVAEAAYPPVTELYRYEPDDKIRIILKDFDDYANGAAYYYLDTIEIWTTPLDHDFDMRGTTDWLGNVVTHEFIHVISLGAARKGPARMPAVYLQVLAYQRESNRPDILLGYPDVLASYPISMTVVPMWFAEGVSQYQVDEARHDRWDTHRDMVLRTAVLNDRLLSFDEMGVFGKRGLGNEFVYDHGYGLVRHIATEYGDRALADLSAAVSGWGALEFDGAIDKVLGVSAGELHDSWRDAMAQTYRAQVDGLGPLREGEEVTEEGFSNIHPAYAPDGKRLAYLSTGKRDYGPHALIVRDLESDEDELIQVGVVSSVSWSPDGSRLVFVQKRGADKYGSRQADLFEYSFEAPERGIASQLLWTPATMVSGYAPDSPRVRRLTRGIRALYPAYSPDGEWIAFIRNQGSTNNLGLMRADGSGIRYLTDFDDGTQLYTPRWSPDGTKLALSVSSRGQRDIALLDLGQVDVGSARETPYSAADFEFLVATQGTDRDPAWSADGGEIVFSSDHTGIFNLYSIDIATGETEQVTNVVGAALNPSVSPVGGEIAFASYGPDGYRIRSLGRADSVAAAEHAPRPPATDVRDAEISDAAAMLPAHEAAVLASASPPGPAPAAPPASEPVTLAEHAPFPPSAPSSAWDAGNAEAEIQPYGVDFLRTLVLPRLIVDEGRFKGGAYLAASDVLFKQNVFIGAAMAPTNRDRDLFAIYEYRKWRPTLFLEFFHQKKHTTRRDSTEARTGTITGMDFSLSQVSTGLTGRLGRSAELRLSATYDRYDASLAWEADVPRRDGQPGFNREKQKPFGYTYLHGFGLGATYRMEAISRRRDREINPLGRRLYFRYDRMYNYFLQGFDEGNTSFLDEEYLRLAYNQYTVEWQEFVGLPWNTGLGLRFYGGWIASDEVDDDELVNDFFDYHLGGLNFMKGYTFYSIEGRKAAMASATLRFPLLGDVGARFAHLYVDKVYGAVYADIGKAWDDDYDAPDPVYQRQGPLRDLGAQLRFDLFSYYSMPTKVQFDAAYGIDEPSGHDPWKYYLTVLFGYL